MTARHTNVLDALNSTYWAITPEKFEQISGFVGQIAAGSIVESAMKLREAEKQDEQALSALAASPGAATSQVFQGKVQADDQRDGLYYRIGVKVDRRGVARVPVHGTVMKRLSLFASLSGGTSTELLAAGVKMMAGDDRIKGVLFDVDSPGGSVEGLSELSAAIRALGKPSASYANDMMCSAAYWIGSAANKVFTSPDAIVGSIGVITSRWDYSEAYAEAGVKQKIWRSASYKALGYPSEPVSTAESKETQRMVDAYYANFTAAVQLHRNLSDKEVAAVNDGRVYVGSEAVNMKLADDVKTYDEATEAVASAVESGDFKAAYEGVSADFKAYQEATASALAAKDARIAELEAQIAEGEKAAAAEKADAFIASLVADRKVATVVFSNKESAEYKKLHGQLVANYDDVTALYGFVPKGAAGPAATLEEADEAPSTANAKAEAIQKAAAEGKAVAESEESVQNFLAMGLVEGEDFIRAF